MIDPKISRMWLDRADYDMDTAKAMLQTGRLIYAIFMCQQSLEKYFKALLAYEDKEIFPIHNLRRLAEFAVVVNELDESTLLKLDFLSSFTSMPVIRKIYSNYRKGSLNQWSEISSNSLKSLSHGFVKR